MHNQKKKIGKNWGKKKGKKKKDGKHQKFPRFPDFYSISIFFLLFSPHRRL